MADILIEFLTEQPVLGFQSDDTGAQLIYLLKQRGVGVYQLALIDTRRRKKFHRSERMFKYISATIPILFLTLLLARESMR